MADDLRGIQDHIRERADCYCIKTDHQFMMEIFYQTKSVSVKNDNKA